MIVDTKAFRRGKRASSLPKSTLKSKMTPMKLRIWITTPAIPATERSMIPESDVAAVIDSQQTEEVEDRSCGPEDECPRDRRQPRQSNGHEERAFGDRTNREEHQVGESKRSPRLDHLGQRFDAGAFAFGYEAIAERPAPVSENHLANRAAHTGHNCERERVHIPGYLEVGQQRDRGRRKDGRDVGSNSEPDDDEPVPVLGQAVAPFTMLRSRAVTREALLAPRILTSYRAANDDPGRACAAQIDPPRRGRSASVLYAEVPGRSRQQAP